MSKDLLTGIAVVCLAVAVCALMPIAGLLGSAFIPLPGLFYRAKLGGQAAGIITAAALGFVVLLGGWTDTLFFGGLLVIGYILAELMARRVALEHTVAAVCGAVAVMGGGLLLCFSLASGEGVIDTLSAGVRTQMELTLGLYREMGVPQEQMNFLEDSMAVIEKVLVGIMPAMLVASTMMVVWVNLLSARKLFEHRGLAFPDYGPLDRWKAPEMLVWAVIASGVMLLVPSLAVKTIGLNGLLVMMVIYFFQGMAIVAFFINKKKAPRLVRIVLYGLIALQQLVMLAVIGVGLFDTWFNFRKLEKPVTPG